MFLCDGLVRRRLARRGRGAPVRQLQRRIGGTGGDHRTREERNHGPSLVRHRKRRRRAVPRRGARSISRLDRRFEPPEDHPAFTEHKYWHKRYRELLGNALGYHDESRTVYLPELLAATKPGRTSPDQVTFSERGNLQGAQFHAVAGRVYEACLARGLGREIPTDWLVEDERN